MKNYAELIKARLEQVTGVIAQSVKGLIYFKSDTNRPIIDDGTDVSQIMMEKHLAEARRATKVQLTEDANVEVEGTLAPSKGGTGQSILTGQAKLALVVNNAEDGYDFAKAGGGTSIDRTQALHGLAVLDAIYHNGTIWVKAQADDADTLAEYIVSEVPDVNTFTANKFGAITLTAHGKTVGEHYFLSDAVAGGSVIVEPLLYSSPLYYVEDANTIHVEVYRPSDVTTVDIDGSVPLPVDLGTGVNIDASLGSVFYRSTFANLAFTFSNIEDGQTLILIVENTTGTDKDITFDVGFDQQFWAGGPAAVTIPGISHCVFTVVKGAGNRYYFTAINGMTS